jgi:hypothetical protein
VGLAAVFVLVLPRPAPARQQPRVAPSSSTRVDKEAFLSTAGIVTERPADGRASWRVSLDGGSLVHDASVNTEDGRSPTERNARFNVAAYELDKLLGLGLVAPSVERSIEGRPASVSWWVDDVAMSEVDRRKRGIAPPDPEAWSRQFAAMRVFDELISNAYRDTSPPLYLNSVWDNLLIDQEWEIWLVDHTGAFRARRDLRDKDALTRCPRSVLSRLRRSTGMVCTGRWAGICPSRSSTLWRRGAGCSSGTSTT